MARGTVWKAAKMRAASSHGDGGIALVGLAVAVDEISVVEELELEGGNVASGVTVEDVDAARPDIAREALTAEHAPRLPRESDEGGEIQPSVGEPLDGLKPGVGGGEVEGLLKPHHVGDVVGANGVGADADAVAAGVA